MAQIAEFRASKFTFGKHCVQILEMKILGCAVEEDVVEEHRHEFAQDSPKIRVHQYMEDGFRVGGTKWDDEEFVMTFVFPKGHVLLIQGTDQALGTLAPQPTLGTIHRWWG